MTNPTATPGAAARMMANWQHLHLLSQDVPNDAATAGIIYIAGPMTSVGPPTWNYPAFHALALKLRAAGYTVINPAELQEPSPDLPWDWYLRRDLRELVKCSRLVLLEGWTNSRGARLEYHVAQALGMEIIPPHEVEETLL